MAVGCGSRAAAEDSVQEALARAWERSERGERIESLAAWVTTAAFNLSRSWLRRTVAERRSVARLVSEAPIDRDDRDDLQEAIASIPRRQRQVIVLRYYLGLPLEEISRVLRIAPGTVKANLFKARKNLAVRLGEEATEEADASTI